MRRIVSNGLIGAVLTLALAACSADPERDLQRGYSAARASVTTTTALVKRDAIDVAQAQRVETIGRAAKQSLDANAEALRQCRAEEAAGLVVKCGNAQAAISGFSTILLELEKYLNSVQ